MIDPDVYLVPHTAAGVTTKYVCGTTFLKAIIQKACVDTIATVTSIRQAVARLDQKMEEVNSDIKVFNEYVQSLRSVLHARGESTDEFISHLFTGYAAASDQDFVMYMKEKRNQYEDGMPMDANQLLQRALNKYNISVQTGRWNAPDKKDAAIFALKSELTAAKERSSSSNGKENKQWAWKKVQPAPGESKTKTFRKKTYHWCPNHEKWTIHTPEQCEGKDYNPNQAKKVTTETARESEPVIKELNKALKAVMDDGFDME
jgi:hypothetical protein